KVHDISSPTTRYNGTAIWGGPNGSSNIQYLNNKIQNVYAAMRLVGSVTGLIVTGNSVNGTTSTTQPIIWVDYNPRGNAPTGVDIENNTIRGVPSDMTTYVVNLNAGSGKFINNTIYTNGNKAIRVENSLDWVSSPNTITTGT